MRQSYEPPKNEQDFELVCCDLLRVAWDRPALALLGVRGERQHGIDIIDITRPEALVAAQCKRLDPAKPLSRTLIKKEVADADGFPGALKRYAICTTAKKSAATQKFVLALNSERQGEGRFPVEIIFWDELEPLLDAHDELRERLTTSSHLSVRTVLRGELARALPEAVSEMQVGLRDALHEPLLEQARQLLDAHEDAAAALILEGLRRRSFEQLTPRQQFRLLTNLGVAKGRDDKLEEAAQLMLRATEAFPEHEDAGRNRARALALLGRTDEAWEAARDVFRALPSSASAVVYVECSLVAKPTADVLLETGAFAGDADVLVAAAERATRHGEQKQLEQLVEHLREKRVVSTHTKLLEIVVELSPLMPRDARDDPDSRPKLKALLERLTSLVDEAQQERDAPVARQATLTRIDIAFTLDDPAEVTRALDRARDFTPKSGEFVARMALARAQVHLARGEHDAAVRAATTAVEAREGAASRLIKALALWARNDSSDRENSRREALRALPASSGVLLEQVTTLIVRAESARGHIDDAVACLDKATSQGLGAAHRSTLLARLHKDAGAHGEAAENARVAYRAVTMETSTTTRRLLASTLYDLGLAAEAVETLSVIASKASLDPDTKLVLGWAYNSGLHAQFLLLGEALFEADALDQDLSMRFVLLLEGYDCKRALDLVRAAMRRSIDADRRRLLHVHERLLCQRLGETQSALDLEELPRVDAVPVDYVSPTVQVLLTSEHAAVAAQYAYACVLRFPDEPGPHAALIRTVLIDSSRKPDLTSPEQVAVGTVTEYRETSEDLRRLIIEEHPTPGHPDMVSPTSFRAMKFLGKRVGDQVTLASGSTGERIATICSINHAWLDQLRRSMNEWQERFPDTPLLEQSHFEKDPATGELDVSPMIRLLERMSQYAKKADEIYRSGCVPIGLMAGRLGRSVFAVMEHLAHDKDLFVNCVIGSDEAMTAAKHTLEHATHLVLDETAIWTVGQLGLGDVLRATPVPARTVQQCLDELGQRSGRGALQEASSYLSLRDDGRLLMDTESEAAGEARRVKWSAVLDALQLPGPISSQHLSQIGTARRDRLISYVGDETAHAIAAAAADGAVLWTDDRVATFLAEEHIGSRRVWTQAVLAWLLDRSVITADRYRDASARLLAMRFSGTLANEDVVVSAARLAGWDTRAPMFERCLDLVVGAQTRPLAALRMALALVRDCASRVSLSLTRAHIVTSVATLLLKKDPSGMLLRALRRSLPRALTVNVIVLAEARDAIDVVLRTRTR